MPNCPKCNTPDAYVGFTKIECPNPNCENYEPSLKKEEIKDEDETKLIQNPYLISNPYFPQTYTTNNTNTVPILSGIGNRPSTSNSLTFKDPLDDVPDVYDGYDDDFMD